MNVFDLPKLPLHEELTNVLAQDREIKVERIVSAGQTTDWYDQDENEFVVLLQGTAELAYENGETAVLCGGDTVMIPKHRKHRVSFTSNEPPCIWLCVFWR